MSLDPTHSEVCLNYSIKKFFVDRLKTIDELFIDFSTVYMDVTDATDNKLSTWIVFHMGGNRVNNIIKDVRLIAYIFSRGKAPLSSEDLLAQTRDTLYQYLIDLTMTDGLARIPLYDITDKTVKGSLLVYPEGDSANDRAKDNTIYRYIPIRLKFAVT